MSVWFWSAYRCQPNTRRVGRAAPATTWPVALRDGVPNPPQAPRGMVRPDQDRIRGRPGEHVEVDETWAGGRTRAKGRGVHDKVLVASAVEVRQRKPGTKLDKRKGGRYAGGGGLAIVPDRSASRSAASWSAPLCRARRSSPTTLRRALLRRSWQHPTCWGCG